MFSLLVDLTCPLWFKLSGNDLIILNFEVGVLPWFVAAKLIKNEVFCSFVQFCSSSVYNRIFSSIYIVSPVSPPDAEIDSSRCCFWLILPHSKKICSLASCFKTWEGQFYVIENKFVSKIRVRVIRLSFTTYLTSQQIRYRLNGNMRRISSGKFDSILAPPIVDSIDC